MRASSTESQSSCADRPSPRRISLLVTGGVVIVCVAMVAVFLNRQRINALRLSHSLCAGEKVEYWSSTKREWVNAKVLGRNSDGTFKLNCKGHARPEHMRHVLPVVESEAGSSPVTDRSGTSDGATVGRIRARSAMRSPVRQRDSLDQPSSCSKPAAVHPTHAEDLRCGGPQASRAQDTSADGLACCEQRCQLGSVCSELL